MSKFKILYVDSDSTYAQTCVHNLIEQGYSVKYVTSIKDALIECAYIAPAIVIERWTRLLAYQKSKEHRDRV